MELLNWLELMDDKAYVDVDIDGEHYFAGKVGDFPIPDGHIIVVEQYPTDYTLQAIMKSTHINTKIRKYRIMEQQAESILRKEIARFDDLSNAEEFMFRIERKFPERRYVLEIVRPGDKPF